MAKRFTDTAKWDKAWFRKLSPQFKCAWQFLCDRCDHAGVWDLDLDAMEFFVGVPFTIDEIKEVFGEKVEVRGQKLLIADFADFQYGHLNPENRVHKSVLDRLEKLAPSKPLKRPSKGSKDTDTDKDADTETEKGGADFLKPDDLAALWNANRGVLPEVKKLSKVRRTHAKAQLAEHPDPAYWLEIIMRWRASSFCTTQWLPDFDALLNENKRIATLEGRYDNRNAVTQDHAPDTWESAAQRVLTAIKKAGSGSSAYAEREQALGPELHALAVRAGIQRIRDVKADGFALKTIAQMLRAASENESHGGAA